MAETTTTTTKAAKKKQNRPDKGTWSAWKLGVRSRLSYALRAKNPDEKTVADLPENYVSYEEFESAPYGEGAAQKSALQAVSEFLKSDAERINKYVLKGLNDANRQAAAFGARKIERMILNAMEINKKLTRKSATKLVNAMLAATE